MTEHFIHGIDKNISEDGFINLINEVAPKLILQMNNGALKSSLKLKIKIPVVNIIVDEASHLFVPEAPLEEKIIDQYTQLVIGDSKTYNYFIKKINPSLKEHVHLIPSAGGGECNVTSEFKHNISFIGSFLNTDQAKRMFFKAIMYDDDTLSRLLLASTHLAENYEHDFKQTIDELNLMPFLDSQRMDIKKLKHTLSIYISASIRIDTLNRVAPLGLSLFGNEEWGKAKSSDQGFINCYQSNEKITTRKQLMEIYNTSKISINAPQVQASSGLAYRVYDVLKSKSLLIIPFNENSDAFNYFGKDCPIPMYKDLDHLYELCEYYLSHEKERKELVVRCNDLVKNGFSFTERAQDYLRIANVAVDNNNSKGEEFKINLKNILIKKITLNTSHLKFFIKYTLKRKLVKFLPTSLTRRVAEVILFLK